MYVCMYECSPTHQAHTQMVEIRTSNLAETKLFFISCSFPQLTTLPYGNRTVNWNCLLYCLKENDILAGEANTQLYLGGNNRLSFEV